MVSVSKVHVRTYGRPVRLAWTILRRSFINLYVKSSAKNTPSDILRLSSTIAQVFQAESETDSIGRVFSCNGTI